MIVTPASTVQAAAEESRHGLETYRVTVTRRRREPPGQPEARTAGRRVRPPAAAEPLAATGRNRPLGRRPGGDWPTNQTGAAGSEVH